MKRIFRYLTLTLAILGASLAAMAQETTILVKGSSWDSDSWGFAFYQNLSKQQALLKAARRGARVSVLMYSPSRAREVNLNFHLLRHNQLLD